MKGEKGTKSTETEFECQKYDEYGILDCLKKWGIDIKREMSDEEKK
jgi:hypothetical protein